MPEIEEEEDIEKKKSERVKHYLEILGTQHGHTDE